MRRAIAIGLLLVAALLVSSAQATPETGTGVRYSWVGPMGTLEVAHGAGDPFFAWDSNGLLVSAGFVATDYFMWPVINSGPDESGVILRVRVGDAVFVVDDDSWEWE
jgi:hypothetical protein